MSGAEIAIGIGLLLLASKKKGGASASTPGKGESDGARMDDGISLLARANQSAAQKWVTLFRSQDVPEQLAQALARWAGIESSGNPLAQSKLGERGLMQIGPASAKDGNVTPAQWAEMISPATTNEEHAKIAYSAANWLWNRALKHLTNPPADFQSGVWYAKLYHQWPVDVRDGKLHGPALPQARELAERWKNDAVRMHRLRAANVVAFGQAELP